MCGAWCGCSTRKPLCVRLPVTAPVFAAHIRRRCAVAARDPETQRDSSRKHPVHSELHTPFEFNRNLAAFSFVGLRSTHSLRTMRARAAREPLWRALHCHHCQERVETRTRAYSSPALTILCTFRFSHARTTINARTWHGVIVCATACLLHQRIYIRAVSSASVSELKK